MAPHYTNRGDTTLAQLAQVADEINEASPDLVFDLGDRITDADHARNLQLMKNVAIAFGAFHAPGFHICGDHDRNHLSAEENANNLGQSLSSKTIDAGTWHIRLWRAEAKTSQTKGYRGFDLPKSDFLQLTHHLAEAAKPSLVFSPVPESGHAQTENFYFESNSSFATYLQFLRVRRALRMARVPIVFLSDHIHWNSVTQVDGAAHLTQQSLTESSITDGNPAGAWGTLDLGKDSVVWEVYGLDPFFCTLPVKA